MNGDVISNKVHSLYRMCIKFVASHISLVESLTTLPDLIGEEIFKCCMTLGVLDENTEKTKDALHQFVRAYGTDFISALKCPNILFLSEFQEPMEVLCLHLTKLDLSGCEIGNSSTLLPLLHKLRSLEVLILEGNKLSDEGFRKMLLPMKVYKKGFELLSHLNVCRNNLTLYSLSNILRLPKLTEVLITLPSIADDYQKFMKSLRDKDFEEEDNHGNKVVVTCEGWGSEIMSRWQRKLAEYEELRRKRLPKIKKPKFYTSSKAPNFLRTKEEIFDQSLDRLFRKRHESSHTSNESKDQNLIRENKRPCNLEEVQPNKKKKTYQDVQAELFDFNLLSQYRPQK